MVVVVFVASEETRIKKKNRKQNEERNKNDFDSN